MKYLVEVYNKIYNRWETRGVYSNLLQISNSLFINYQILLDIMRIRPHPLDDTYRISLITYKYDIPDEPCEMNF